MAKAQIDIDEALHKKLVAASEERGIEVGAFVEQLLSDGLSDGAVYQKHDEEKIKERLKSLGYID